MDGGKRISYASVFADDSDNEDNSDNEREQAEAEQRARKQAEEKAKQEAEEAAAAAAAAAAEEEDDWTAYESSQKKKKQKHKQNKLAKKKSKAHEDPTADIELMVFPHNMTAACRAMFQESYLDEFGKQRTTAESADRPFDVWHGYVNLTLLRCSLADASIFRMSQAEIDEPLPADHPISDLRAKLSAIRIPPLNIKFGEAAQQVIPDIDPRVVVEVLPESRDQLIKLQEQVRAVLADTEVAKELENKHVGAPTFSLTLSKYTRATEKVLEAWASLSPEDRVATDCGVVICCLANDELPAPVADKDKAVLGADVSFTRRRLAILQLSKEADEEKQQN